MAIRIRTRKNENGTWQVSVVGLVQGRRVRRMALVETKEKAQQLQTQYINELADLAKASTLA